MDTFGLRQWKAKDFVAHKTYRILDGFYISDRVQSGIRFLDLDGNQQFDSGKGSDRFYLATSFGTEMITDFQDLIALTGGLTFKQLSISQDNGNTLIKLTSNQQVLDQLFGVNSNQITATDFLLS